MSTRVQWRRGNTAQTAVFTGAQGEITVNTDTNVVVVHDGVSAGGFPAPTLTFSQGGFDRANDASSLAQAAYNAANAAGSSAMVTSAYNHANGAFDKANSANVLAQAAFDSGNNTLTFAQSGYDKANTSGIVAQAAFDKANADNSFTQSAFDKANTAYTNAGDAYNYTTSVDTKASAAFNKANSANVLAQSAYDSSNTKFSSSGGTISGSVNITGQANVSQRLSVGTGAYTILPNLITQFTGTSDWYSQINQQNLSGKGSGDVVVTADNGTDQINFIDMGIAGSVYDDTTPNAYPTTKPNDAYLYLVGDPSSSYGGNLVIGTAGSSNFGDILIVQGTGYAETARFVLGQGLVVKTGTASVSNTSGALVVQGGVGITGDIYAGHVYDNGIELKTYTDTANTFLQANDALTLAASKSYTDSANTKLKSYVDGQIVVVQNEIASNLATAESYTDTANTYNRTYTNNANTAMKSYVDGQVIVVQNEISSNLATAKSYTDTANTYNQNYTNSANTALKSYVDGQIVVVQNEIASNLATAEAYTDTANTYNRNYTNSANTALKSYVDGQVIVVQNEISSNLATAEAYTDTANAYNRTYTNNANTAMKSYVDGQVIVVRNEIDSNLATAEAYTDTANNFLQANDTITLSSAKSYTDTANTKLKSYVDGKYLPLAGGTVTGAVSITDTTGSASYSSGALVVSGGVGVGQNLNVYGNTIISGSLTVNGPQVITSSSVVAYNNPYIILHEPASGSIISDDGADIGVDFEYYSPTGIAPRVITSGSADGANATIYITDNAYVQPGGIITVSGVTPSDFNGTYKVKSSSPGQITYPLSYTGSIDTSSTLGKYSRVLSVSITSGSTVSGSKISTINISPAVTLTVGQTVTIFGVTPTGYNGTWTVLTASAGSFTFQNTSNLGNISVNGTVVLDNRRGFFGRCDDTGDFEFYRTGTWTPANTFAGLYGTIKAGQFDAVPNDSSTTADIQAGFIALYSKKIIDSTSVTNDQHGQVAAANLGIITIASSSANVNYSGAATLRILGAPVAGNNVSLDGNVFALQVDSGISYFGGGINVNSQGVTFSDGTTQKTNAASFAYSTAGFNKANASNVLAQSAYDSGNSTLTYATAGFNKANAGNVLAQSSYDFANTVNTYAFSSYSYANATNILTVSAYNKANAANVLAQSSYDAGNSTNTLTVSSYNKANAANVLAQSAYDSGNSTYTYAQSGYTKANNAVQTAFVTVSANGTSITPSSNTDTLTLTAATANGINILNPSSKTIDFGLRTTGVVAGGYGNTTSIPSITVDTFGRVTSVSNNTIYVPPGTSIVANTGQLTANASTGIVALGLATTAVSAGNYGGSTQIPVLAIDAYGRITSASNTSVSTTISLAGGSGSGSVSGGGTLTFTGSTGLTTSVSGSTVTLTNTGVTSLTSNSSARITQSATTGAVAFDLATTAVTAGTYNYSTIQVDAYGRITSASSGTPVTTFNTRSGAVTLTSSDVTSALTYTPANVAGDQFTGAVTATSLKSNTSVTVNTSAFYTSTAYTTSSVSQVTVDSFPTATYRSAKYFVQMTSGTSYHVIELNVLHDGTNPLLAQYGEIFTGSSLGTFDVSITTGNLNLLFTPTNSATTVKLVRTNIVV